MKEINKVFYSLRIQATRTQSKVPFAGRDLKTKDWPDQGPEKSTGLFEIKI